MAHSASTHTTLEGWVASASIPFSLADPAMVDTAVDRLIAALSDEVAILGFGEALHGGEALLQLRNRLFQRLVETHGYSAIAVESSFPRAPLIDAYVAGRGPASYEGLGDAGWSHGFGRLEANRELIEWMRQRNAERGTRPSVRFYGVDGPMEMMGTDSPRQLVCFAIAYVESLGGGDERRVRIEALLGEDAAWENPAAMFDPSAGVGLSPAAAALRIETEDLLCELEVRRPDLTARGGRDRYLEAVQHAVAARQLLAYHAELARPSEQRVSRLLGIRDALIADTVAAMAERERGRGKLLFFAHNRHIQRGEARWTLGPHDNAWWPAGAQLHARLGGRYAAIGTALGVSAANGIGQPEAGTLEALLSTGDCVGRFIPTYGGRGLPAAAIAALPARTGSLRNSMYMPLGPASFGDFDWLALVPTSEYARGGPPLPEPERRDHAA